MIVKRLLLVLDFDGVLLNSYALIREAMAAFGLDVGDEERFRNRRKFLKYLGGGKELLNNLVGFTLPKTRKLRDRLTQCYLERGEIYPEFTDLLNGIIANPRIHCGIVSRNFTVNPGPTIRTVLRRSGIFEADLDFLIPVPIGARKIDVLAGMYATRYRESILCADEIGDYHAAVAAGYTSLIASYGFDTSVRLLTRGEVPAACVYDAPAGTGRLMFINARRRPRSEDAGYDRATHNHYSLLRRRGLCGRTRHARHLPRHRYRPGPAAVRAPTGSVHRYSARATAAPARGHRARQFIHRVLHVGIPRPRRADAGGSGVPA